MKARVITDIDRANHERKMKIWRHDYPLASAMMSNTKLTNEQVMILADLGKERRLVV